MDPYLNPLAHKMLAEMPEDESDLYIEPQIAWGKNVRRQLGGLLISLGHRIQASTPDVPAIFDDIAYPALDDELPASR